MCAELLELSKLVDEKKEKILSNVGLDQVETKGISCSIQKLLKLNQPWGQLDSSILISNENQLTLSFPHNLSSLFLKVYILEKAKTGISVVSCAQEVLAKLQKY
ncbi:MAG: hypothetical protein L6V79_06920 [Clostridium sp.]|nr:MAG: hypothetical protein L6V79_06920 [Clostridium sp.]